MADRRGFERRLYGSDHCIRWRAEDIAFIAAHFGITENIPTEAEAWQRQKARARASAAFLINPLLGHADSDPFCHGSD
jgi:hypothetical protein